MSDGSAAWAAALHQLEQELDALEHAVSEGHEVVAGWTPPTDLGPLPDQLRSRAESLHRRIDRATARVRAGRDEMLAQRQDVSRRRTAVATYHGVARETDRHQTA